jgi:hypothetical protein
LDEKDTVTKLRESIANLLEDCDADDYAEAVAQELDLDVLMVAICKHHCIRQVVNALMDPIEIKLSVLDKIKHLVED